MLGEVYSGSMALIIPPGYLQAVYVFLQDGDSEEQVVTCGHEIDGASGATGEDAADDLFLSFANRIVDVVMSNQFRLMAVDVYVGNDGGNLVYRSGQPPQTGAGSDPIIPQNSANLIRKRTDTAGRRGRGRMYLPSVPESAVNTVGVLTSGYVANMQAAFDNWYDDLTAMVGGRLYPPVVLHRSEGSGVEPPPTAITQFVVDSTIATQRRRLRP